MNVVKFSCRLSIRSPGINRWVKLQYFVGSIRYDLHDNKLCPTDVSLDGTGLQQQTNVRFRWQLLGDNINMTGILRIDDVTLTVSTGLDVGNAKGDVLVNEIMYYPVSDEPEWVELYNTSSDTINLKNWKISDSNISTKSVITQTDVLIPPSSYLVIAKDVAFASCHFGVPFVMANFSALNNSTPDAVVIYDAKLNTIDSVMYSPSWGGQNGKSLERIDVEMPSTSMKNWGTSQDSLGSTPGKEKQYCSVRLRFGDQQSDANTNYSR